MTDAQTLNIYAERADEYAALTEDANKADPLLSGFIDALPRGGHVLDLGCGPGASAAKMAEAGLQVDAYDAVPQMVALAAVHEGVHARQATFEDVSGTALYDGVWANFSLLHAERHDLPQHLGRIAAALKPGGRFHLAVKTGTGSHRDRLGRLYTYYTDAELTGLLNAGGFEVIGRKTGRGAGLSGEEAPWIALTAIRA
ncbi:MAG: class I SAM-dependent methyltransferase [Pseudomonadota bacterium]